MEYKWVINQMSCVPQIEGYTDVVLEIKWSRIASDVNYSASMEGTYTCPMPSGEFTPYDQLTFDEVCLWLNAGMNAEYLDAILDKKIEEQKNPPIVDLPLPWVTPEVIQEPIIETPIAEPIVETIVETPTAEIIAE